MAGYQSAEAYDFSIFEPRSAAVQAAQPAVQPTQKPKVNPNLRVVPKRTVQQEKQQARSSFKTVVSLIICCAFMFSFIALYINNSVKNTEITNSINVMETNINNVKSENVRLSSAIDGMFSIANVDAYATDVLGMSKMENYQIQYIDLSSQDQVLFAGEKSTVGIGFIDQILTYFRGLFA